MENLQGWLLAHYLPAPVADNRARTQQVRASGREFITFEYGAARFLAIGPLKLLQMLVEIVIRYDTLQVCRGLVPHECD
jgi:hypothetical protein